MSLPRFKDGLPLFKGDAAIGTTPAILLPSLCEEPCCPTTTTCNGLSMAHTPSGNKGPSGVYGFSLVSPQTVTITCSVNGAPAGSVYSWEIVQQFVSGVITGSSSSISATIQMPGTVSFSCKVTLPDGTVCLLSRSFAIEVTGDCGFCYPRGPMPSIISVEAYGWEPKPGYAPDAACVDLIHAMNGAWAVGLIGSRPNGTIPGGCSDWLSYGGGFGFCGWSAYRNLGWCPGITCRNGTPNGVRYMNINHDVIFGAGPLGGNPADIYLYATVGAYHATTDSGTSEPGHRAQYRGFVGTGRRYDSYDYQVTNCIGEHALTRVGAPNDYTPETITVVI